jgi:hypothetical protein
MASEEKVLRNLQEKSMGRIPDQDGHRAIIEFLDDIDPDYDAEFRGLSSRERALGQVASQSERVPSRTTAQCCTRVENSPRDSRSREIFFGLERSRFTRAVSFAFSEVRQQQTVADSARMRRLFRTATLTVCACPGGNC